MALLPSQIPPAVTHLSSQLVGLLTEYTVQCYNRPSN